MRKLFFISLLIIAIMPTWCNAEELQNPTDLTGTTWKYIFETGNSLASKYIFEELKFISATDGEIWMQPVVGDIQKVITLTYVVNGSIITITPLNDVPRNAIIDNQKKTMSPTDFTVPYSFTKE